MKKIAAFRHNYPYSSELEALSAILQLCCPPVRRAERSYSGQTASACLADQFNPRSWVCYATQLRSSDSERKNGSAFSAKIAPRTGGNTSKKWQFPGRTWHGIRLIKRLFKGESNPII